MRMLEPAADRVCSPAALRRSAAWVLMNDKLGALLRRSYGHPLSVHALAGASLALLLSAVLYFLSPLLEDDYHIYRRYLPWVHYLDWSQYDSFIVDHGVVFASISLPITWLFLVNLAYSPIATHLDVALLLMRVVCCATVCVSLTVLLTEFFSTRIMIALIALGYGAGGLLYAWSVPLWRWYEEEAHAKGLIAFLPEGLQQLLLRTSLLEWLTDTTFMDRLRPFLPFLLPLSKAEQSRVLEEMPVETQLLLTRPGMLGLLPTKVQRLLLPTSPEATASITSTAIVSATPTAGASVSADVPSLPPTATAGFSFHEALRERAASGASDRPGDAVADIVTKRVMRTCRQLVQVPSATTLNRTMTASTAIFALQLYASRGSRRMLLTVIHFAVASSLVSIASFAFVIRFIQLLTTSGQTPLLRYFRQYLIQSWTRTAQIAAQPAAAPSSREDGGGMRGMTLRKAATSASAVAIALYVLRRLRR